MSSLKVNSDVHVGLNGPNYSQTLKLALLSKQLCVYTVYIKLNTVGIACLHCGIVLSTMLSVVLSTMLSIVLSTHISGCSFSAFGRFSLDTGNQPNGPQYHCCYCCPSNSCVCVCVCVCVGLTLALDLPF